MSVFEKIAQVRVVPVVALNKVSEALPLADALLSGGLPLVEVTFRTAAAAEAIALLAAQRPELLVGAGTVLAPETARIAAESGARFAVAPGLNPRVVAEAQAIDLPFIPGVATPSEIEGALDLGCRLLKLFPAKALGGIEWLNGVAAPYLHTGVRFMPTGGVSTASLQEYLSLNYVAAVGGTWIAGSAALAAGDWSGITERCRRALTLVQEM